MSIDAEWTNADALGFRPYTANEQTVFIGPKGLKPCQSRAERTCVNLANYQGRKEFVCSECAAHYIGFHFDYCPKCGAKVVEE